MEGKLTDISFYYSGDIISRDGDTLLCCISNSNVEFFWFSFEFERNLDFTVYF